MRVAHLLTLTLVSIPMSLLRPVQAQQPSLGAPWDSVARVLRAPGTMTGNYYRYALPRRDLTVSVGDVTVAPELALGAWVGFSGPGSDATMMGDLVVTAPELPGVLAELAEQEIDVVAQVSFNLVPGTVTLHGRRVTPALGYGTPINLQMVNPTRAVATGDFAVLGRHVDPVLDALAAHRIAATAVHSHLIDEEPTIYYMHFWADGHLEDVLRGLRAALDAAR